MELKKSLAMKRKGGAGVQVDGMQPNPVGAATTAFTVAVRKRCLELLLFLIL